MKNQYDIVDIADVPKSGFDLSHNILLDVDLGKVIPILCEECLPGDYFEISNQSLVRAQALVAPIFHNIQLKVEYFFIPNRILFEDWEKFITGGEDGADTTTLPSIFEDCITAGDVNLARYDLWDYFGLPMHNAATGVPENSANFTEQLPVRDFPWRAYWAVWRDYYRDQAIQLKYPDDLTEIGQDFKDQITNLDTFIKNYYAPGSAPYCDKPFYRLFRKDYFVSARPYQQLGTSPTIPISGTTSAVWDDNHFANGIPPGDPQNMQVDGSVGNDIIYVNDEEGKDKVKNLFADNEVAFAATGVDIADLRLAVQTQKFMERNMRAGYRYGESLRAHFGITPQDFRLQKPEFIGATNSPVVISEVLQTSQTETTPQGTMAGHGMSVNNGYACKYRCQEHGYILGLLSLLPESIYQQGIPRQFSRETKEDYYFPEYAHISEQEILKQELYFTRDGATTDETRFAWQAAWDEYRNRRSKVCGKLASDLKYWCLSRIFSSAPALNEAFLTTEQLSQNRRTAWALSGVQDKTYGQFIVQFRNDVKAIRPLPYISTPGKADHF